MKRKKHFLFAAISVLMILVLSTFTSLPVSANSAQSYWEGRSSSGALVTDENCPIVLEKELLTFDIQDFTKSYYSSIDAFLAYTGKVPAEYTFYNPSDYTVTATLVFPFGNISDYGYIYNPDTGENEFNADRKKYDVTIDGAAIEKTFRHTLSYFGAEFEFEQDMALLHDGYVEDSFYIPDTTVTKYTYTISAVDKEYDAADVAFEFSGNNAKTKVYVENQTGVKTLDDGVQISVPAENGNMVTVYVIGQPLEEMLQWRGFLF